MARRTFTVSGGSIRLRRRTHPTHWAGPATGSVLTVLAWSAVARSSGSGWVQTVGALLAAVLATGLLAPAVAAHRLRVSCVACPADTTAGFPATVRIETNGPARLRPLLPVGEDVSSVGPARGRRQVEMAITPDHRGVIGALAVEIGSSLPFGMVWWVREIVVPLPRPLHVAPRHGTGTERTAAPADTSGEAPPRVTAPSGEPKGVRPYEPGDRRRAVHWPVSAHTAALMVREYEEPTAEPVVLVVDLPADPAAAERYAEQMMGLAADELARGTPVVLSTLEPDGRRVHPVVDTVDLGRRLARAVAPGTAP